MEGLLGEGMTKVDHDNGGPVLRLAAVDAFQKGGIAMKMTTILNLLLFQVRCDSWRSTEQAAATSLKRLVMVNDEGGLRCLSKLTRFFIESVG